MGVEIFDIGRATNHERLGTNGLKAKVTKYALIQGYRYKMRSVYAHFPINCNITDEGRKIEIRNFLGEKFVRKVDMRGGVTVTASPKQKDELIIDGNDIELVSLSGK